MEKEINSHFDLCKEKVSDCEVCKYIINKINKRKKKIPLFILQRKSFIGQYNIKNKFAI